MNKLDFQNELEEMDFLRERNNKKVNSKSKRQIKKNGINLKSVSLF